MVRFVKDHLWWILNLPGGWDLNPRVMFQVPRRKLEITCNGMNKRSKAAPSRRKLEITLRITG